MREILRKVGFFILGIVSLFYVIFVRNFAEIRVQIPFLNFPIFIGEILLFICLILSFFVFDFRSIKGWRWCVVFYFICIILKAFWGYILWGPLAFRHAALFYYPVFIFFGFIFYKRAFLSEPLKIFVVLLILALCVTKYFCEYWVLTLWIIAFILTRSFCHRAIKYFFYAGLLLAIFLSYKDFILTSRTFIVGNIAAVVFLIITLLHIAKIKVSYKVAIVGTIFIILASFVFKHSSLNASGTILDIKGTMSRYRQADSVVKAKQQFYVPGKLKEIKLFNPEQSTPVVTASNEMLQAETLEKRSGLPEQSTPVVTASNEMLQAETLEKRSGLPEQSTPVVTASNEMLQAETLEKRSGLFNNINNISNVKPIMEDRSNENAYNNTLFRLFIWRDMIVEFSRHWPILGFSFGKPFRSKSLEILEWAVDEWKRDGWIEPHNSYLNMLYRAGILGVALIGFLIWQFSHMVMRFIALKSLPGILLCSTLFNWLAAANFLPILELPYNAIPFWALWGVALGYLKELEDKR